MLCLVEGQVLLDATEVGNLLEIGVCLLVRQNREKFAVSISLLSILFDDALGNVEEEDVGGYASLLTLRHNPLLVAHRNDVVGREVGHIDISQPCEARKDEDVTHQLQAFQPKVFVGDADDFLIGQEATIDGFQVEAMIEEGVVHQDATLLGIDSNRLESFHLLDGRVVRATCDSTKIQLEVLHYGRSKLRQPNILASILVLEKLKEVSAKYAVLLEAIFADGFPDTLLDVVNKRVEDGEKLSVLLGLSAIDGADFVHRERFVVLQLAVNTIEGVRDAVECSIGGECVSRSSFESAGSIVP